MGTTQIHEEQEDVINEQSPLLAAQANEDIEPPPNLSSLGSPADSDIGWEAEDDANQESKSTSHLFLLALAGGGLQIAWSVELSYGSPYLLSLGIQKSLLALVWIAGPLSGALVQPLVGVKSDQCRSRFGKRRPFIVGGAMAIVLSLGLLSWAVEVTTLFGLQSMTIGFAVLMVYVLDFAINVVQASTRVLIVDSAPTHQQELANAWALRVSNVANLAGYVFGYMDLPKYFGFLAFASSDHVQFKILCALASISLLTMVAITCFSINERDPRLSRAPENQGAGLVSVFQDLYRAFSTLPPQVRAVCAVQLCAWIAWFPWMFYVSTYVGEIYAQPFYRDRPGMSEDEINEIWQEGARIGSLALMAFAIICTIAGVVLPFIILNSHKLPDSMRSSTPLSSSPASSRTHAPSFLTRVATDPTTRIQSTAAMKASFANLPLQTSDLRKHLQRFRNKLPSLEIRWLTLRRAWLLSHLLFVILTLSTFLVGDSVTRATILVGAMGVPFALMNWAPFAIIAAEISLQATLRNRQRPTSNGDIDEARDGVGVGDQAGAILGIHNVFICAPQAIATLISSVIFRALQKPRGSVGDESLGWVLRCSAIGALAAAWLCRRIRDG